MSCMGMVQPVFQCSSISAQWTFRSLCTCLVLLVGCARQAATTYELAEQAMSDKRWQDVITLTSKMLSGKADSTEALMLRGRALVMLESYEEAGKDFSRVIALRPTDPEPLYRREFVYQKLGWKDLAKADGEKAKSLDVNFRKAFAHNPAIFVPGTRFDLKSKVRQTQPEKESKTEETSDAVAQQEEQTTDKRKERAIREAEEQEDIDAMTNVIARDGLRPSDEPGGGASRADVGETASANRSGRGTTASSGKANRSEDRGSKTAGKSSNRWPAAPLDGSAFESVNSPLAIEPQQADPLSDADPWSLDPQDDALPDEESPPAKPSVTSALPRLPDPIAYPDVPPPLSTVPSTGLPISKGSRNESSPSGATTTGLPPRGTMGTGVPTTGLGGYSTSSAPLSFGGVPSLPTTGIPTPVPRSSRIQPGMTGLPGGLPTSPGLGAGPWNRALPGFPRRNPYAVGTNPNLVPTPRISSALVPLQETTRPAGAGPVSTSLPGTALPSLSKGKPKNAPPTTSGPVSTALPEGTVKKP